ncbi:MAG TPA: serine/threonine-protein kinase, partial [Chloroflexia bacterium]|nr:serine/threonine-protein kinase [Chloroflexia bacterium]
MIHPGAVLNNRYRLDKKIGEGGFAVVFLGQDLVLGRTVAVKLMDASLAGDKELLGRFQLEARAVAALDHPNILTVHDFGLLPDSAFLVMPYIGGGPLSARLRTERLSLEEIGRYLEQISSALDYAHRNGIVHRDVKPQNILLRNDGRAVLTDFGFAKLLVDANAEAQTRALGTVHYVAPEQIRGLVSAATDQYSLGILLYQMISNALPFNGTPQQILIGHVQQPPPSLASQPSMQGYSPEMIQKLDQVLARALAKAASARYPSCMALYNAYMEAIQPAVIYGGVAFEEKTVIDPRVAKSPAQGSQLQSVGQVNPQPQVQAAAPNYNQPVIPSARPVPVPAAPGGNDEATELYVPVIAGPQQQPQPKPVAPVLVQPARLTVRTEP